MFPKAPPTDTFQDCLMQSFFQEWSTHKETYGWKIWDDMIAGMSPEELKGML